MWRISIKMILRSSINLGRKFLQVSGLLMPLWSLDGKQYLVPGIMGPARPDPDWIMGHQDPIYAHSHGMKLYVSQERRDGDSLQFGIIFSLKID